MQKREHVGGERVKSTTHRQKMHNNPRQQRRQQEHPHGSHKHPHRRARARRQHEAERTQHEPGQLPHRNRRQRVSTEELGCVSRSGEEGLARGRGAGRGEDGYGVEQPGEEAQGRRGQDVQKELVWRVVSADTERTEPKKFQQVSTVADSLPPGKHAGQPRERFAVGGCRNARPEQFHIPLINEEQEKHSTPRLEWPR